MLGMIPILEFFPLEKILAYIPDLVFNGSFSFRVTDYSRVDDETTVLRVVLECPVKNWFVPVRLEYSHFHVVEDDPPCDPGKEFPGFLHAGDQSSEVLPM